MDRGGDSRGEAGLGYRSFVRAFAADTPTRLRGTSLRCSPFRYLIPNCNCEARAYRTRCRSENRACDPTVYRPYRDAECPRFTIRRAAVESASRRPIAASAQWNDALIREVSGLDTSASQLSADRWNTTGASKGSSMPLGSEISARWPIPMVLP